MMKETEQLEKINPKHKNGLIILAKNLLKSFQTEQQSKDLKRFTRSISAINSIKNYIPSFIIESYCREFIENLVRENITEDDKISREIDHLLMSLESRIDEWNVIIPLENITLKEMERFEIGNTILLNPDEISQIFNNTEILKDMSKEPFLSIQNEIQHRVCACIKVKYDSQEVYNSALDKIRPIINILRIYACFNPNIILLSPIDAVRVKIGTCGTTYAAKNLMISFKPGKGWGARKSGSGIYPKLVLDKEFADEIRSNYEFEYISHLLCKEHSSLSDFEKQLLIAIRWIGLGIDEDIGADKIIKFATALECLVLAGDDQFKKETSS